MELQRTALDDRNVWATVVVLAYVKMILFVKLVQNQLNISLSRHCCLSLFAVHYGSRHTFLLEALIVSCVIGRVSQVYMFELNLCKFHTKPVSDGEDVMSGDY